MNKASKIRLEKKLPPDIWQIAPQDQVDPSPKLAQHPPSGGVSATYTISPHHKPCERKISKFAAEEEPPKGRSRRGPGSQERGRARLEQWRAQIADGKGRMLKRRSLRSFVIATIAKFGSQEGMLESFGDFLRSPNSPIRGHVRTPTGLPLTRRLRCKRELIAASTQEFTTAQVFSCCGEMKRGSPPKGSWTSTACSAAPSATAAGAAISTWPAAFGSSLPAWPSFSRNRSSTKGSFPPLHRETGAKVAAPRAPPTLGHPPRRPVAARLPTLGGARAERERHAARAVPARALGGVGPRAAF